MFASVIAGVEDSAKSVLCWCNQQCNPKPLFPLGDLVATRNAADCVSQVDITAALQRHMQGDWGLVDTEDWEENDRSVTEGFRLLSVYESTGGTRFWIITEAD